MKPNLLHATALATALCAAPGAHAQPFMGELMLFGGTFCPDGYWLPADGRLLPVAGYEPLYTLIGTTYGGNGVTDFGLPDLRGRTAVGQGQGFGLGNRVMGEKAGAESATLTQNHMPAHAHTMSASTAPATHATPATGRVPATAQNGGAYAAAGGPASGPATGSAGSGVSVNLRSPYMALQWCIAVTGIFPSLD